MTLREFTLDELRRYNGRADASALVACYSKVCDVTTSYHYRGGSQWVLHFAGADLTGELAQAPHEADLVARFPVVGVLVGE